MEDMTAKVVLLIEPSEEDALFLMGLLKGNPLLLFATIIHVKTLKEAFMIINQKDVDVVLVNLFLHDSQGMNTFLKIQHLASSIPIIILTNETDEKLALETVAKGAQDYISKQELTLHFFDRTISFAIEREHVRENLRTLIFTDELTNIYNRRGFLYLTQRQLELALRLKKGSYLFLIDVDNLKDINDTYGHLEGDKAIKETAHCLEKTFRRSDIIGRIGGDEFAVFAFHLPEEKVSFLIEELNRNLKELNAEKKHPFKLSLSFGGAYLDENGLSTLEELLKKADLALYAAKSSKKKTSSR